MDSIEGFILVGGQSRRMGTDKSQLLFGGQSFVDRIALEVGAVTSSIRVVGSNSGESRLLPFVADVFPGWGALGGVHAALSACAAPWALVVACDFPFVTRELFARLATFREGFEAVSPIQSDGIPQPLCTLYRIAPCLDRANDLIKSGERKPLALLQSVDTRWVSFDELADLAQASHLFDNVNTPDDYARLSERGLEH